MPCNALYLEFSREIQQRAQDPVLTRAAWAAAPQPQPASGPLLPGPCLPDLHCSPPGPADASLAAPPGCSAHRPSLPPPCLRHALLCCTPVHQHALAHEQKLRVGNEHTCHIGCSAAARRIGCVTAARCSGAGGPTAPVLAPSSVPRALHAHTDVWQDAPSAKREFHRLTGSGSLQIHSLSVFSFGSL